MIFKCFLLGNRVSLSIRIRNSVVVVALYYGFLTILSIWPSYLFLLRAWVMEEGTEKKVSATTGFITGQIMMFISIYYAPLHLALGRPYTITVLALPYLFFHFFWFWNKHFFDYGSTTRNSMRNLSIQRVFLNNLIFQLFNHFILPSSILVRLVNISMFRCNNKMLFVTSSFVGWLIGHILFMKWVGLILVWIQQNNSIRSNKYLVSELRNSMARILTILLVITSAYTYLRTLPPSFLREMLGRSETEESEEDTDGEIPSDFEMDDSEEDTDGEIPSDFEMDDSEEDTDEDSTYEMDDSEEDTDEDSTSDSEMDDSEEDTDGETPSERGKGGESEEQRDGKNPSERGKGGESEERRDGDSTSERGKGGESEERRDGDSTSERGKGGESEEQRDGETPSETEGTKQEQEGSTEEDTSPSLFSEEKEDPDKIDELEIDKNKKDKSILRFEKPLSIILFDYNRCNRPFRYIKNYKFDNAVRKEMSQYFFYTCKSDGKDRIVFTYPPSVATFLELIKKKLELIKKKISLFTSYDEFDNPWNSLTEQNKIILKKKIRTRILLLDKGSPTRVGDILQKRTQFFICNNQTQNDYLPKKYDPLLSGPYRRRINFGLSVSMVNETSRKNDSKNICTNKIQAILDNTNIFNEVIIPYNAKASGENSIDLTEISKKVPRWPYKLIKEIDQQYERNEEDIDENYQIRSRKFKRMIIFSNFLENIKFFLNYSTNNISNLSTNNISNLSTNTNQISTNTNQISTNTNQISTNTNQISYLSFKNNKIRNLSISIKNTKIRNLSTNKIRNLSTNQISDFSTNQISDFSTNQISDFSTNQISYFSTNTNIISNYSTNTNEISNYSTNTNKISNYSTNTNEISNYSTNTNEISNYSTNTNEISNYSTNEISNYSTNTDDTENEPKEIAMITYANQSDFRREIIKGSIRAQRRKIFIWKLFERNVHSYLFFDRLDNFVFSFDIPGLMKKLFRPWIWTNTEFTISNNREEKRGEDGNKTSQSVEDNKCIEIAELWDHFRFAQVIRSYLLVTQSILRKYIFIPSVIIANNLICMLFFSAPHFFEDFQNWNKEIYVKCTYNGIPLSEEEVKKNWLTNGIQIKILFPFRLNTWHTSRLQSPNKDSIKKKGKKKKKNFTFLTIFGLESERPFGTPRQSRFFCEPKVLKEKKKKLKNFFRNISKNKWVIKNILFIKQRIRELKQRIREIKQRIREIKQRIREIKQRIREISQRNAIGLVELKEIYEEAKNEKNSIISNRMSHGSSILIRSMDWIILSLREKKIKDLTDKTNTILKQIEKIRKDPKKELLNTEINISPNKISYHDKIFESQKNIFKILKKRNVRLIRKSHDFLKFFVENIYIDIFQRMINMPRINGQLFIDSIKKKINKSFFNNEANKERIDKTNQSIIHFILTIKKSLSNITNNNGKIFGDLSYLSQAYLFYKLSQTQIINLSKLRPVFQYHGTSRFLKNEIQDYFVEVVGAHEILHSDLKQKNLENFVMRNQWKNWLRVHYNFDLYPIRWSKLLSQKWRNRVKQERKNKDFNQCYSYEKKRLIDYKKQKHFKTHYSLPNKKDKKKQKRKYIYDSLSYKSINYEDNKDSYIYELPVQVKNNQESSYKYNTDKFKFFDILTDIPLNNYLGEDDIIDLKKTMDRKYFDWRMLHFSMKNKVDIGAWIHIEAHTNRKKNTKTPVNNFQLIEKIKKKKLFSINQDQKSNPSNNKKKIFLDWMRLNEEILRRSISNLKLGWFFPEFLLLYIAYKINPWIIPIKSLLFNLNGNRNKINLNGNKIFSKKKKLIKKRSLFISAKEKTLELENGNKAKKESVAKEDVDSVLSNHTKYLQEDSAGADVKKPINKKQSKKKIEKKLDWVRKKKLHFQLKWTNSEIGKNLFTNIKGFSFILRQQNFNKISISSIQNEELNLDIMLPPSQEQETPFDEFFSRELLLLEPICLAVKNDGKFIMSQTIGISLGDKNKYQFNQRYQEKGYPYKRSFAESIAIHQKTTENRTSNHYDLLVPENILSPRGRREFRILICFNSGNQNDIHRNPAFYNGNKVKTDDQVLDKRSKHLDRYQNKLKNLKFFLWPNYRLEDLACMNRYWFDTNNSSRFSMLRIHMYPQLQIR